MLSGKQLRREDGGGGGGGSEGEGVSLSLSFFKVTAKQMLVRGVKASPALTL